MKHFRIFVIALVLCVAAVAGGFYFGLEELVRLNDKFQHFRENIAESNKEKAEKQRRSIANNGQERIVEEKNFDAVYFQFTGNFDFKTQMHYIGDHRWQVAIRVPEANESFVFIAEGEQQTIFGDSDVNGEAEESGDNIPIEISGLYIVRFDERSLQYDVTWRGEDKLGTVLQSKERRNDSSDMSDKGAPPIARAGNDIQINIGESAFFDASASTDPDDDISAYEWSNGLSGDIVTKTYDQAGEYVVMLTVTDEAGNVASDEVIVNVAPRINGLRVAHEWVKLVVTSATGNIQEYNMNVLSDHLWATTLSTDAAAQLSILVGANPQVTLGDNDVNGVAEPNGQPIYMPHGGEFMAQYDDLTRRYNLLLGAGNLLPTAHAGRDQTVQVNETVLLNASQSADPDGYINQFWWDDVLGEPIKEIAFSQPGRYEIRLTVVDDKGATSSDSVAIDVLGEPRTAAVQGVEFVAIGHTQQETLRLVAENTWEADLVAQASAYQFETYLGDELQRFGDNEEDRFADVDGRPIDAVVGRQYTVAFFDDRNAYRLTEKLNQNNPPVVILGDDLTVTVGENFAIDASASYDQDGFVAKFEWADGSVGSVINRAISEIGMHEFELTITDDQGASASDSVRVFVEEVTSTEAMFLSFQSNGWNPEQMESDGRQWRWEGVLDEPDQLMFLSGEKQEVKWGDTNGDGIADKHGPNILIANAGYVSITLYVDTMAYSIDSQGIASIPSANAGVDQIVTVGEWVQFDGTLSRSMSDGSIVKYQWSHGGIGAQPAHQYTTPGVYEETLTVHDANGEAATDTVTIRVENSPLYSANYQSIALQMLGSDRSKLSRRQMQLTAGNLWTTEFLANHANGMQFELHATLNGSTDFLGAVGRNKQLNVGGKPVEVRSPGQYSLAFDDLNFTYDLQWLGEIGSQQLTGLTIDLLAPGAQPVSMKVAEGGQWSGEITSDVSWHSPKILFVDQNGQKYGDTNGDGVLDINGAAIEIESGGHWSVKVEDTDLTYTIARLDFTSKFEQLFVRYSGVPIAMEKIADYTWSAVIDFDESNDRFDFDVFGNGSLVYGDDDSDRLAEEGGGVIYVPEPGVSYEIRFYDNTLRYVVFERPY